MIEIRLLAETFDPWRTLSAWADRGGHGIDSGACSVFIGTLRDFNAGAQVREMWLEHYPGMTERQLQRLVKDAQSRWRLNSVELVHRVGRILPGEAIVLIAVSAAHRGDAADASRHLIEALKASAPFWKKETLADGSSRWVTGNTLGYASATA